jgi:hypothetical protein
MPIDPHTVFILNGFDQPVEMAVLELDQFVAVGANDVVMVTTGHQHVIYG